MIAAPSRMPPMNGHRPQPAPDTSADDFQSPPWVLTPLYPHLKAGWRIWEPAAGAGNLVRALEEHGWDVLESDYRWEIDFFHAEPLTRWHCQVTNPPYSRKNEWIRRSYELGRPFALLLPVRALETAERQEMFDAFGVEVICLGPRVHCETPLRGLEDSSSWFGSAWFTWGLEMGRQLSFWRGE